LVQFFAFALDAEDFASEETYSIRGDSPTDLMLAIQDSEEAAGWTRPVPDPLAVGIQ
jgi:hypothetical protein